MRIASKLVVISSILATLSSCAYLIPEDPNMPRNNTVLGPLRKPTLNVTVPQGASTAPKPMTSNEIYIPPVKSAEVAAVESTDLPPAVAPVPAVTAADDGAARRMPVENAEFRVAGNDYPPINSVPPRPPTTGDSPTTRLKETQAVLEKDRTATLDAKSTLDRDAAAEPSMLTPLPDSKTTVVPPNDPVAVTAPQTPVTTIAVPETKKTITVAPVSSAEPVVFTPAVAAAQVAAPSSAVVFASPIKTQAPVAPQPMITASSNVISTTPSLPAIPVFAPPTPAAGTARTVPVAAATPVIVAALPALGTQPSSAPVMVESYDPEHPPETFAVMPNVKRGDFNPMASAMVFPPAQTPVTPGITTATAAATAGVPTVRAGDFNPMSVPAPKQAVTASLNQSATAPTIKRGDFDPMAAAEQAPTSPAVSDSSTASAGGYAYASTGYISASRYADRRY